MGECATLEYQGAAIISTVLGQQHMPVLPGTHIYRTLVKPICVECKTGLTDGSTTVVMYTRDIH